MFAHVFSMTLGRRLGLLLVVMKDGMTSLLLPRSLHSRALRQVVKALLRLKMYHFKVFPPVPQLKERLALLVR